jgi:hypothetical protein
MSGVAVRAFGKVRRPYSSINECFQSSLPSALKHISSPCVPCTYTLPVSPSTDGEEVE